MNLPNLPNFPAAVSSSLPPKSSWRRRLLWLAVPGVLLLGLVIWLNQGEPPVDVSDLPECFADAYRIRRQAPAQPATSVRGVGVLMPPKTAAAPESFTKDWFERNFTHYTRIPLFVWASPKHQFPSHGKINPAQKVIFGKEVDGMILVCVCTEDGKPMNMFIENGYLQPRSQGPPPLPPDD